MHYRLWTCSRKMHPLPPPSWQELPWRTQIPGRNLSLYLSYHPLYPLFITCGGDFHQDPHEMLLLFAEYSLPYNPLSIWETFRCTLCSFIPCKKVLCYCTACCWNRTSYQHQTFLTIILIFCAIFSYLQNHFSDPHYFKLALIIRGNLICSFVLSSCWDILFQVKVSHMKCSYNFLTCDSLEDRS